MKSISFTDFRKNASSFISEVEHDEMLILFRHGKPITEMIPFSEKSRHTPSWKQPGLHLQIPGSDLSSAILHKRELES